MGKRMVPFLLGSGLIALATLIVAIRIAWVFYGKHIQEFYEEAGLTEPFASDRQEENSRKVSAPSSPTCSNAKPASASERKQLSPQIRQNVPKPTFVQSQIRSPPKSPVA